MQENIQKFYFQIITDACVKIVVGELCFEIKTKESAVGTFSSESGSSLMIKIC